MAGKRRRASQLSRASKVVKTSAESTTSINNIPQIPMDLICSYLWEDGPCKDLVYLRQVSRHCMHSVDSYMSQEANIPVIVELGISKFRNNGANFQVDISVHSPTLYNFHDDVINSREPERTTITEKVEKEDNKEQEPRKVSMLSLRIERKDDPLLMVIHKKIGRSIPLLRLSSGRFPEGFKLVEKLIEGKSVEELHIGSIYKAAANETLALIRNHSVTFISGNIAEQYPGKDFIKELLRLQTGDLTSNVERQNCLFGFNRDDLNELLWTMQRDQRYSFDVDGHCAARYGVQQWMKLRSLSWTRPA